MGQVIVIASGNGGTGKTMFAVNLGASLAIKGARVLLLDLNSGMRNIDIVLGLEDRIVYDLGDVLNGTCQINQAMIRDRRFRSLYLISASQNMNKPFGGKEHLRFLCDRFKEKFDYVIIDSPPGRGQHFETALSVAELGVIIMTQGYGSLRGADILESQMDRLGIKKRGVIINRVKREFNEDANFPSVSEISDQLRSNLAGVILEDEDIHIGCNCGIPVVCRRDSRVYKNFDKISEVLLNNE